MKTIQGPPQTDPLARQYLPREEELRASPGENADPIGDEAHTPVKGIVHRYPDRVLLKPVNVCAVYCRYCFRREKVGPGNAALNREEQAAALDYIRTHPDIREVILTGGDPLVLSPKRLSETLDALCAMENIQIIRIHTRAPVADPERITVRLCAALDRKKAVYVAVHVNHPQEITLEVERAFDSLRRAGCVLLSQSVLLKGVNNDAATLEALFRKLVALRVKPYYLHHPDYAPGTAHFRLTVAEGQALMKTLQGRVSGLCLPRYMLDIPGGHGKIPIGPCHLEALENGAYLAEDFHGRKHAYPPESQS
jgi:lysine 2,3-aminomutase